MDSKGSSLPSMPEPANPISMKQPPESLSVRKGRGDVSGDPSLLMDKAAAQLAATLQDGVLQKMSQGHGNHERLKDLTSRVLNGDQDALPKLCGPETPVPKGAEVPAVNGAHRHDRAPHGEPELKATVPQVAKPPLLEPCGAVMCDAASGPDNRPDAKKRRGRPHKPKPQRQPRLALAPAPSDAASIPAEPPETPPDPQEGGATEQLRPPPADASAPPARFAVGDVVWTKVSGYPWWPCIVTTDPELDTHIKQKANSRSGLLYHVQYFGDAPERGYIFEKNIVSFTGESQYQQLSQGSSKQAAARHVHKKGAPSVPRKLKAQWNMGIIQAKEAVSMSLDDRLANFRFVYDDDGPRLNPHILDKLKPEEGSLLQLLPQSRLALEPAAPTGGAGLLHDGSPGEETAAETSDPQPGESQGPAPSGEAAAPLKKKRRPKQPQSTTKRRRKKAAGGDVAGELKKRKSKSVSAASGECEPGSLPASAPVKKGRKRKVCKRLLTDDDAVDKDQQPKRRRRKNLDKQASATEGGEKKQRRRRKKLDKDAGEPKKRQRKNKVQLTDDQEAEEKPKRRRKRKQEGESEVGSKAKKRRISPCPDPEGSGSEGRPESPSDSLDGTKKGERKKEFVCQVCEQAGEDLVACEGQCCGMFHLGCLGLSLKPEDKLLCQQCSSGVHACFSCKQSDGELRRCHVPHCGKFYHEACVRLSPLTIFDNKGFRCPLHTCLSCHYGCRTKHRSSKGRLMRCLRCPVAYHVGDLCVAAGSEMITNTAIICTNHFHAKKGYSHHSHVNVSWCFVCSKGGQLLCCESCPAAFHPDCLNIAMPDGSWFCNDCRAGKKPKYRDIIWVKLGTYRWWPAEIHHPRSIPTNIQHLRHEIGEFPVFFFGSKDYFWTHQGRVFPYMEGDRGSKHQRTGIGKVFKNALSEAETRFKEIKMKREAKEAQENNRKPPPYKFIKVNKPVGKVQVYAADVSEIPKCNCKPADERPCGFESECLNRMLQYECHPQVCPSGERCCNQDFTKRLYPETKIIRTAGKGWGLVALRDIKKGEFVNEYIGELIDEDECRARIKSAHENNITDFYMLTIDKDRIIDAGPKGNYSRFMNHSCQPNCETQKWTVNGDTRVGLFAVCDIPTGTELTFNYNLDCLGNEKTVCRCGAPNCSGFLGDRPKNSSGQTAEPKGKRLKRKYKRRKSEGKKKSDDECFRCGDGGQLVLCGKKACTKAYHLTCLNLAKRPFGRWDCPWHHCDVCGKNSEAFCQLCPNSFCKAHQEGALRPWPPTAQLCCLEHDEQDRPAPEHAAESTVDAIIAAVALAAGQAAAKASRKADGGKPKSTKRKAAEA